MKFHRIYNPFIFGLIFFISSGCGYPSEIVIDETTNNLFVIIDCTDEDQLNTAIELNQKYFCSESNHDDPKSILNVDNQDDPKTASDCPKGTVFIPALQLCQRTGRSSPTNQDDPKTASDCPKGTVFIPALQLCQRTGRSNPTNQDDPKTASDCPKGTVFIPALQLCQRTGRSNLKNQDGPKTASDCPKGTVFIPDLQICQKTGRSNPKNQDGPKTASDCPKGTVFIPDLQICQKTGRSNPKNQDGPKTASDCPKGTVFIPDLQICQKTGRSNPKNQDGPKTASDCPKGTVFVPDLQVCIPMNRIITLPYQNPIFTPVYQTKEPKKPSDCEKGTVFVPSLQICVPETKTMNRLVSEVELLTTPLCHPGSNYNTYYQMCMPNTNIYDFTHDCGEGFAFSPEESKCVPHVVNISPAVAPNYRKECPAGTVYVETFDECREIKFPVNQEKDLTQNDSRHERSTTTVDFFGCKTNEVYVSEIDVCLPINNCFPYQC